jgi:RHS repeat-associated protein
LHYIQQDSLGSTSFTTDASGSVIGTISYLPFGSIKSASGTLPAQKFTGQRLDATGLYYYNARYYDATIGRFISPDTVIQSMANPQCFNRYSYCLNNPLIYADPSGHVVVFNGVSYEKIEDAYNSGNYMKLCEYLSDPLVQAFCTLSTVDSPYTSMVLNNSSFVLNITTYSGAGGSTYASSSGSEMFIGDQLELDDHHPIEDQVKYMAHEMVHSYHNMIDPGNKVLDSKFEENLGDIYSHYICKNLKIDYTDPLASPLSITSLRDKYFSDRYIETGYPSLDVFPTFSNFHHVDATYFTYEMFEMFGWAY